MSEISFRLVPVEEKPYTRLPDLGRITEFTSDQEEAIRDYAANQGITDLRSFRSEMLAQGWDYYDVLKLSYA